MFRKMRRFGQQITEEKCIEILKEEPRGILSVLGDDGYPYGMPMDHWYCEENGKLYFHGAKEGHKLDSIKACDKVSYCVYDEGYCKEGEWALNINSVIVFGRMKLLMLRIPIRQKKSAPTYAGSSLMMKNIFRKS